MLNRRLLAVCVFSVLLGGCATAPGSKFTRLEPVAADKANLYVYRQGALFAMGQSFKVDLNQQPIGEIFNASYLMLQVPAGQHVIDVRPGGLAKTFAFNLSAEPGRNYFLEFDFNSGLLANPFFLGSEIKRREQEQAIKAMAELKSAK